MKKAAIIFIIAVWIPSFVLAWLAVRSLRDQQWIIHHQQVLLYQEVADSIVQETRAYITQCQREFSQFVESFVADQAPQVAAPLFDEYLLKSWPLADVGFVVSLDGLLLAPPLNGRIESRRFRLEQELFLSNRESREVYWLNPRSTLNFSQMDEVRDNLRRNQKDSAQQVQQISPNPQATPGSFASNQLFMPEIPLSPINQAPTDSQAQPQPMNGSNANQALPQSPMANVFANGLSSQGGNIYNVKNVQRRITPQNEDLNYANSISRMSVAEAEFRQLIGEANEGVISRFLQNKLKMLIWYRSQKDPNLIFGSQLNLTNIIKGLESMIQPGSQFATDICAALLDDSGKPAIISQSGFLGDWKRPFAAAEIGEMLPHWEVGLYLRNPDRLNQSIITLKWTLGLIVLLMLSAIGIGGRLILSDVKREMALTRQKTDFVSNVSHELKTPLTSIRMFSELLYEGRVSDPRRQQTYLQIITAEAARLTRLINNVLDFSRMERGEQRYRMAKYDIVALVEEICRTYRPHLESVGLHLTYIAPDKAIWIHADRDSLAQIIVNLLSNAEKYGGNGKEITMQVILPDLPTPRVEVQILDRGIGIPPGCEKKIFEQFFRAHDSLATGIQGSGLGLTLARQIARAHQGDVIYRSRPEGGSCFILWIPIIDSNYESPKNSDC